MFVCSSHASGSAEGSYRALGTRVPGWHGKSVIHYGNVPPGHIFHTITKLAFYLLVMQVVAVAEF